MALPSGYKRLQYIRPSGKAWIDTLVVGEASIVMEFRTRLAGDTSSKNVLSEAYHSGSSTVVCPWRSAGGVFQACWGGSYTDLFASDQEWHTIKAAQGYVEVDGARHAVPGTSSTTATMPLFAEKAGSSAAAYGDFELEYAKYWLGGVQVRNLIACETPSGEVGLWDDVNSKFYGKTGGAGSFIAGPIYDPMTPHDGHNTNIGQVARQIEAGNVLFGGVGREIESGIGMINGVAREISFADSSTDDDLPEGYRRLEYVESSGGIYLNTGIKATGKTKVRLDIEISSIATAVSGAYYAIFGASANGKMFDVMKAASTSWNLYFRYNGQYSQIWQQTAATFTERKIIEVDGNSCSINGEAKGYTQQNFDVGYPIFIFAINNSGTPGSVIQMKMRSGEIIGEDGASVKYIPCINENGIVGFWDVVNKVFEKGIALNSDAKFIAGPEL